MIDTHLHIWDRSRSSYSWLDHAPETLQRSHTLADVEADLDQLGVTGVILVQADETPEETEFLLETAHVSTRVLGAVVYLPLHQPDIVAKRLPELQEDAAFCGVRNLTHDRADPDWLLRPDIGRSLDLLATAGVTVDHVGVLPRHLENVATVAGNHPDLTLVIDHLGKPPIGESQEAYQRWLALLYQAAERPNVTAKLSGIYSGIEPAGWTTDQVAQSVLDALDAFGADRLMIGSDWPVCITAGGLHRVLGALTTVMHDLPEDDRRALTTGTAERVYSLSEVSP